MAEQPWLGCSAVRDWTAVGERIKTRRVELFLSVRAAAHAAGISEGLWRQLERGLRPKPQEEPVSPKPATRQAVAQALRWTDESIDLLLAGKEPQIRLDMETIAESDGAALVEELLHEVRDVRSDVKDWSQRVAELEAEVAALRRAHPQESPDNGSHVSDP